MSRLKGRERGASAVEFAIIVSLVFMVLFGIIQFGIAYNRYQSINAAAREGARLGSLENTNVDTIRGRVLNSLSILNPANFSPLYQCPALTTEHGCIEVWQEDPSNPGLGTPAPGAPAILLTSGSAVACDANHSAVRLMVVVRYKMLITIPLWASPAVTATGSGVFKCE